MKKKSWTLASSIAISIACSISLLPYQQTQAAEAFTEETFLVDSEINGSELLETELVNIINESELDTILNLENSGNPLVQIETTMGTIVLELFPREAPQTVANFLALAQGSKEFVDPETGKWINRPFYNGLTFHRVIENFMIQAGSPSGKSNDGPGYSFNDEINARSLGLDKMPVLDNKGQTHRLLGINNQTDFQNKILAPLYQELGISNQTELDANIAEIDIRLREMTVKESYENMGYQYTETVISRTLVKGVIAMANNGPNSNGSQFFITLIDTEWLTGKYTVFGKVRAGVEVLEAIASVQVDVNSKPIVDIIILSVNEINSKER